MSLTIDAKSVWMAHMFQSSVRINVLQTRPPTEEDNDRALRMDFPIGASQANERRLAPVSLVGYEHEEEWQWLRIASQENSASARLR
jgi:hypothetical protein